MKHKKVILGILVCLLVYALVYSMNKEDKEQVVYVSNVLETFEEEKEEEFDYQAFIKSLQEENNNKDIKAVLRIPNTDFLSAVPQGKDNNYYLRRLANKKYSRLGSTYLDYRVNVETSSKLLIYGHNSSKYSMPFEILENFHNEDFRNSHKYIELVTENGIKTYEIFSIYVEVKDYAYYQKMKFNNKDDWYNHIKRMKDKSLYDTGVSIDKDDKILILQTCSTHKDYQKYAKKFLLIISKEVMVNEIN